MELNQDQIAAIIGAKEMEIIALRMEVNRLRQKYEPAPVPDNVQPISKEAG